MFPTSPLIMSCYARYLARSFKSYGSIVNYLCGVKTLYKYLNLPVEVFKSFNLKLTMKGLRRNCSYVPRQALAMTLVILSQIHDTLDHGSPDDVTFWAACLVAFFLLLRKSNLVPVTLSSFDYNKQLCQEDFKWFPDHVEVTLRWTKTNQFGKHEVFSLPRIPDSKICPYQACYSMWSLLPGDKGICFKRPDGRPLIYSQFQNKLRSCLKQLNYPQQLFQLSFF